MTEYIDWMKPGAKGYIYRASSAGIGYASFRKVSIERVTKTQVVLDNGDRFRKVDSRQVGVEYYASPVLLSAADPLIAEAVEARRVANLKAAALTAVDEWRKGAGGSPKLARTAASALLAYANDLPPLP